MLSNQAQKIEEICASKRKNETKICDFNKHIGPKTFPRSSQKKLKESNSTFNAPSEFFGRNHMKQSGRKAPTPSMASVSNV